ncbi:RNA polymerase II elongation factor ELL-like [Asterias amurensis]|uniref:RNA polymerase II elongation factor ELL-like n=1 Tax=Asterias amurensis TaxID=7602 RepID=UPI003AB353C0
MADLVANTQYGLSSSAHSCPDKTALLLKLTDSSLKAIERYQKAKGNIRKTPKIHFKGNRGFITIPVRESGDNTEGFRDFKFTVQPNSVPAGSSYECIQQFTNSKGIPHLDSISCIKTKVIVSATDDVYQTTQEKMKLADEELKKTSTKEVSQKEIKATRKIKKITKRPGQISLSKPSITPKSQPTNTASAISWSNGTKAPTSSRVSHVPPKGATTTKPAVSNRSYRDRVIHLLALRSYKKPELILRLQRDGIVMKDKNQLSNTLSQVATLSRDNAYTLNKHLYDEVQEDWPLYSEADRSLVTKNLRHLNPKEHSSSVTAMSVSLSTSSSSSSTSSSKSSLSSKPPSSKAPSSKIPSSKPPSSKPPSSKSSLSRIPSKDFPKPNPAPTVDTMRTVQIAAEKFKKNKTANKRPLLPDVVDFKAPKKTRIAHNAKKQSPTGDGSSASCSPPSKYDVSSTTKQSPDHLVSSPPSIKPVEKEKKKKRQEPETRSKVIESVGKLSPPSDVSSTSNGPDYLNKFTTIASHEQKQRYKDVFNRDYPEYKKMHSYVEGVTLKFTKLKEQLHNASEDSEEYQQIKLKVLEEYTIIQADKDYLKKESRWRELHEKLAHVKSLIAAYDNSRQHGTTT